MTLHLLLLLFTFFPSATLSVDFLTNYCDDERGSMYSSNSPFQSNLNNLLSSLSLLSTNSTFNTSTHGSIPNAAYGLFLCRGDVGPTECHVCIQAAAESALSNCPNYQEVTVWYDVCQLRYSATNFFASSDNWWLDQYLNGPDAPNPDTFEESEKQLMSNISDYALHKSSELFATGELVYGDEKREEVVIYGMVQCTRDISSGTCSLCLQQMLQEYWKRDAAQT